MFKTDQPPQFSSPPKRQNLPRDIGRNLSDDWCGGEEQPGPMGFETEIPTLSPIRFPVLHATVTSKFSHYPLYRNSGFTGPYVVGRLQRCSRPIAVSQYPILITDNQVQVTYIDGRTDKSVMHILLHCVLYNTSYCVYGSGSYAHMLA